MASAGLIEKLNGEFSSVNSVSKVYFNSFLIYFHKEVLEEC